MKSMAIRVGISRKGIRWKIGTIRRIGIIGTIRMSIRRRKWTIEGRTIRIMMVRDIMAIRMIIIINISVGMKISIIIEMIINTTIEMIINIIIEVIINTIIETIINIITEMITTMEIIIKRIEVKWTIRIEIWLITIQGMTIIVIEMKWTITMAMITRITIKWIETTITIRNIRNRRRRIKTSIQDEKVRKIREINKVIGIFNFSQTNNSSGNVQTIIVIDSRVKPTRKWIHLEEKDEGKDEKNDECKCSGFQVGKLNNK